MKYPLLTFLTLLGVLINSVTLMSAFEAHVVNVTAKIEMPAGRCDALSPGYWTNHDGCSNGGTGESVWTTAINELSGEFSGVFAGYDGSHICEQVWQPACPSALLREGRLCRAKRHTLAVELDVASRHLDLNALIAGADQGGRLFDRLGLTPESTVDQALTAIENTILQYESDPLFDPDHAFIVDAAWAAERIYSFYEDENPIAPQCVYSTSQLENYVLTEVKNIEQEGAEASFTTKPIKKETRIQPVELAPVESLAPQSTATTSAPAIPTGEPQDEIVEVIEVEEEIEQQPAEEAEEIETPVF